MTVSSFRPEPSAAFTLPAGAAQGGYVLNVSVLVANAFGAVSAPVTQQVTARAPAGGSR